MKFLNLNFYCQVLRQNWQITRCSYTGEWGGRYRAAVDTKCAPLISGTGHTDRPPVLISVKQEPAKYVHYFHLWYSKYIFIKVDFLCNRFLCYAQSVEQHTYSGKRPLFEMSLHQVKIRKTIWCSNISIALSVSDSKLNLNKFYNYFVIGGMVGLLYNWILIKEQRLKTKKHSRVKCWNSYFRDSISVLSHKLSLVFFCSFFQWHAYESCSTRTTPLHQNKQK